jgi:hypothetical protein
MKTADAQDLTLADRLADETITRIETYRVGDAISRNAIFLTETHREDDYEIQMTCRLLTDRNGLGWRGSCKMSVRVYAITEEEPGTTLPKVGVFYAFNKDNANKRYLHRQRTNAVTIRNVAQALYEQAQTAAARLVPAQRLARRVDELRSAGIELAPLLDYCRSSGYPDEYDKMEAQHVAAYTTFLDNMLQETQP